MSTLLYGTLREPIPPDENTARATTAKLTQDKQPAEMSDPPEMGEVETDSDASIAGLHSTQLASDWHDREKYAPTVWSDAATDQARAERINRQVASSGTAASREMGGQFGHGTVAYAVGVEPIIADGHKYGNDYFTRNERTIQEGTRWDAGVGPAVPADRNSVAGVAAAGKVQAREAMQASVYGSAWSNWFNGG